MAADQSAIRQQLDRLLSDPLFKLSRRYPKLLQYVVEHTLENSRSDLKERILGVDVFGRSPDYDTGIDPIVRITAAEVRKRLAQYYSAPSHQDEVRIELPLGSYTPEFRMPTVREPDPAPAEQANPQETRPEPVTSQPISPQRSRAVLICAAAAAALVIGLVAFAVVRPRSHVPEHALETFWNPVLGKSDSVLLSVGQRDEPIITAGTTGTGAVSPITLFQLYHLGSQNVAVPDVVALTRIGGLMQSRHVRFHIRSANQTTLSDFRDNPVILVGAFTNDWNMRLNKPLRYSFDRRNSLYVIRDRQNPSEVKWSVNYDTPYLKLAADYALISRVIEPASERMVVAAGGLSGYGTQAASEFLTDPAYIEKLTAVAPRDWERKNMQVVISTRVINGNSGPPEIVTAVFW
jgi:hypothetical protein